MRAEISTTDFHQKEKDCEEPADDEDDKMMQHKNECEEPAGHGEGRIRHDDWDWGRVGGVQGASRSAPGTVTPVPLKSKIHENRTTAITNEYVRQGVHPYLPARGRQRRTIVTRVRGTHAPVPRRTCGMSRASQYLRGTWSPSFP